MSSPGRVGGVISLTADVNLLAAGERTSTSLFNSPPAANRVPVRQYVNIIPMKSGRCILCFIIFFVWPTFFPTVEEETAHAQSRTHPLYWLTLEARISSSSVCNRK